MPDATNQVKTKAPIRIHIQEATNQVETKAVIRTRIREVTNKDELNNILEMLTLKQADNILRNPKTRTFHLTITKI